MRSIPHALLMLVRYPRPAHLMLQQFDAAYVALSQALALMPQDALLWYIHAPPLSDVAVSREQMYD